MFKVVGKNLLAVILGAIIGLIISFVYVTQFWLPTQGPDIGLAIIGVFPVVLIILGLLGVLVGAVIGFLVYNLYKFVKKRK